METSDGKDISHLLRGESGEVHKIGVTEFAWSKSVRKGQYRYIYYAPDYFPEQYPEGFGELYDLDADPWEMWNLYFEPEYQDVVTEMKGDLMDWIITTTRPHTAFGVGTGPDTQRDQVISRYHRKVLADGKINPEWRHEARTRNYL